MITESKKAPAFTLPNQDEKKVSLGDFLGKNVIIYFYPQDLTPTCTQQACDFRDIYAGFKKENTVVLGISPDSPKSHKKFIAKYNLPFDLLSDESKSVIEKYGVWQEKTLFGRTYMGVERTTVVIDEAGKIKKIFRKVRLKKHIEEVMEAVKG